MTTITESLARIEAGHQKLFTLIVRPVAAYLAKQSQNADLQTPEGFAAFLDGVAIPLVSKDKNSLVKIQGKKVFCAGQEITQFLDPDYFRFLKIVSPKGLTIRFMYTETGGTMGQASAHETAFGIHDPIIRFMVPEPRRKYLVNMINHHGDINAAFDSLFHTKDNRDTFVHEVHHIFQFVSRHVVGMSDDQFEEGLMKHLARYGVGDKLRKYILNPRELEAHFVHGLQKLVQEFIFTPLNSYGGTHDDFLDMPKDPEGYLKRRSMPFRIMSFVLLYQPKEPSPQYLTYYRMVAKMYEGMLTDFEEAVTRSKHADF